MVDVNRLKGKIAEKGINIEELAKRIGVDKATLYRKIKSDGKNISIKEAGLIARELSLSMDEVNSIFFSQQVS